MDARSDARPAASYGWVMVAIAPVLMCMGTGSLWTLALFLKPILTDFGWLRGQTAFAFTAGTVSLGLGGLLMGRLADRYATRWVVLSGVVALGSAYLLLARLTTPWEFYAFYCLLGGVGSAALWAPLLANVGNWFEKQKGLALGIAMSASGLGNAAVIKASGWLIDHLGWQQAYQMLGVACLAGLVPVALLVRDPPRSDTVPDGVTGAAAPAPAPEDAATRRLVLWLGVAALFCCISFSTNLVHLATLIQDRGIPGEAAASVLLLVFLASVAGRAAFGSLADAVGGVVTFLISAVGQAVLVFWFTRLESVLALSVLAAAYGLVYSGAMTGLMISVRTRVPLHSRGLALGVVNLFGWIGNGIGAWQGGFLFDMTGSYGAPYAVSTAGALLSAGVLTVFVLPLSRRRPTSVQLVPA